jgi:hypothetical protein
MTYYCPILGFRFIESVLYPLYIITWIIQASALIYTETALVLHWLHYDDYIYRAERSPHYSTSTPAPL